MVRWPAWVRAALAALLIVLVAGVLPSLCPAVSAQGGGSISYGSKVLGRISAELPEAAYSFDGAAGDLVQVRVRNWVGTLDPQAALLTPDGATAASSTRSPFGPARQDATLALFLPQTGVYMLLVSAEGGTNGQFLLTLQGRGPVSATPLAYGVGLDVAVPLDPAPQYFTFDAQDCPTVFTVADLSAGLPFTFPYMVKLRNAQGGLIALLYGGDAVEDRLFLPARSGRYEVEVLSEDPAQQGTIHLLAACADQAPGCAGTGASGVAAGEQGAAAPECPSCFSDDECPDFVLTAVNEGSPEFLFTWPAVEGALYYYFSIVDAWGVMVPGSGWMSEGDTTHVFTIPPAAQDRGPFTAFVQASDGEGTALCADDVTFTLEGTPTEECDGIEVRVDVVPGARIAVASWTPVPGTAAYTVHVYAYDDGGLVGIRVITAPGSASTLHLTDVFPPDYSRFHVDVRAYGEASGGGAFGDMPQGFLCSGGADFEFPKPGPVEWGPAT